MIVKHHCSCRRLGSVHGWSLTACIVYNTGCSKKTDTQFYFWDNFGNSAPILTILSLLQAEIYGA